MNRQDTMSIESPQLPIIFPDNLDSKFNEYTPETAQPYRELPTGDYKIESQRSFKTKDKRDCTVLTLISKQFKEFIVYTPERLRKELTVKQFSYLRNLGLKTSKMTGNQYFDFQLV